MISQPCEVVQLTQQPTLTMRIQAPAAQLPMVIGEAFRRMFGLLMEQHIVPSGPTYVAYFNMDMEKLDIEVGVPVSGAPQPEPEMVMSCLPAGPAAACTYTGPYTGLAPAYDALTHFMEEQALRPSGVAYEHYLNDPMQTPPEGLQTRIVFPLAS